MKNKEKEMRFTSSIGDILFCLCFLLVPLCVKVACSVLTEVQLPTSTFGSSAVLPQLLGGISGLDLNKKKLIA